MRLEMVVFEIVEAEKFVQGWPKGRKSWATAQAIKLIWGIMYLSCYQSYTLYFGPKIKIHTQIKPVSAFCGRLRRAF